MNHPMELQESTVKVSKPRVSMADIEQLGMTLSAYQSRIVNVMRQPTGSKQAPRFNGAQLAALCEKSPDTMLRLFDKARERGLPDGGEKRPRMFTLAEARQWVQALNPRPEGDRRAATLTICNFKGGVGKTVMSMSVAQGLSLRGYKVLCIDFDPQGSLTALFGVSPSDLVETDTVLPIMYPKSHPDSADVLQGSIRPTYWDGIDLIAANHALFSGEFYLPTRQLAATRTDSDEPGFGFYDVLNRALDKGIRQAYDYIVIDTPPALSYMTMSTVWAADALLLPLPPEGIDFMSSAQFWTMLSELGSANTSLAKEFAWVGVVASKVNPSSGQTMNVLEWMRGAYSEKLLSAEIPDTAAVRVGGMELQTVYDISKYVGSQKTYARARTAFDKLVAEVDHLTKTTVWANEERA